MTQRFGRVAPVIAVSDLDRAVDFYVGVLGFTKTFENGHPVGFMIVERDAAEILLSLHPERVTSTENVAHMMVDDASELYDHLIANGTRIIKKIRDADYGLRGFVFADPDGNRIDVGQQL